MHPKLYWLSELVSSLGAAMGENIAYTVQDTVDPLKKIAILTIRGLDPKDFNPIQTITHEFAKSNDCVVSRIRKPEKDKILIDILTKTRLGEVQQKNPLKER